MILELVIPLWYHAFIAPILPPEHIPAEKTVHETTQGSVLCNCIDYVRLHRTDAPPINASEYVATTSVPFIGAVALMTYASGASHVAYVADVRNGQVLLYHANVEPCKERIEWRDVTDWRLLGYW